MPLLRPQALLDTGDESRNLLGSRCPRSARRGTTTITPSPPPPRHGLRRWELDPSALVIRAWRSSAWRGTSCGSARSARPEGVRRREPDAVRAHRSVPRGARPLLSRAALRGRVLGRHASCRRPVERRRPDFTVRSPQAVAHALRAPGQLGLGRAYVSGMLEVDDVDAALKLLDAWQPPPLDRGGSRAPRGGRRARRRAHAAALPAPPWSCARAGKRHSRERDARAVRHHYDVGNEFFALFLDESMTYSCAVFSRGAQTLEEAQVAEARPGLHEARPRAGSARARRGLRLGQLRPPRRPALRRAGGRASRCRSHRPRSRASGRPRPGWRTRSTSG